MAVRKHFPELAWVVEWLYGSQPLLFYGKEKLLSCEGVQQGCPLGPLMFALVLLNLTDKLRVNFPRLKANIWYLDDGSLKLNLKEIPEVVDLIV